MHFLIFCVVVASALAIPQGYGPPVSSSGGYGEQSCGPNEILHVDGRCVRPVVNRNVFLYAAPVRKPVYQPPPKIPDPKVDYNIVFVQTPEAPEDQDPIVVPPPQQKTLVYVLNKEEEAKGQQVIEIPSSNQQPEVFYVNFNEGENLQLPGGIDINSALASANAIQGQSIGGFSSSGGFGSGGIGGGGSGGIGGGGSGGGSGGGYGGGGSNFGGSGGHSNSIYS